MSTRGTSIQESVHPKSKIRICRSQEWVFKFGKWCPFCWNVVCTSCIHIIEQCRISNICMTREERKVLSKSDISVNARWYPLPAPCFSGCNLTWTTPLGYRSYQSVIDRFPGSVAHESAYMTILHKHRDFALEQSTYSASRCSSPHTPIAANVFVNTFTRSRLPAPLDSVTAWQSHLRNCGVVELGLGRTWIGRV